MWCKLPMKMVAARREARGDWEWDTEFGCLILVRVLRREDEPGEEQLTEAGGGYLCFLMLSKFNGYVISFRQRKL
jgi:hypothetical protein